VKSLLIVLSLLFSSIVMAESVCSKNTKVCASYESDVAFTTKQEGRFELELTSNDEVEVNFVKIDLWMQMGGHGHGSSPLKVTSVAPGKYDITKAYFVMRGEWQIRVTYKQGSVQETLIIPVLIKE
jgi:hypothetical protein